MFIVICTLFGSIWNSFHLRFDNIYMHLMYSILNISFLVLLSFFIYFFFIFVFPCVIIHAVHNPSTFLVCLSFLLFHCPHVIVSYYLFLGPKMMCVPSINDCVKNFINSFYCTWEQFISSFFLKEAYSLIVSVSF